MERHHFKRYGDTMSKCAWCGGKDFEGHHIGCPRQQWHQIEVVLPDGRGREVRLSEVVEAIEQYAASLREMAERGWVVTLCDAGRLHLALPTTIPLTSREQEFAELEGIPREPSAT